MFGGGGGRGSPEPKNLQFVRDVIETPVVISDDCPTPDDVPDDGKSGDVPDGARLGPDDLRYPRRNRDHVRRKFKIGCHLFR